MGKRLPLPRAATIVGNLGRLVECLFVAGLSQMCIAIPLGPVQAHGVQRTEGSGFCRWPATG
jgi:hypothetical protein